jgi:hypothetical protein
MILTMPILEAVEKYLRDSPTRFFTSDFITDELLPSRVSPHIRFEANIANLEANKYSRNSELKG